MNRKKYYKEVAIVFVTKCPCTRASVWMDQTASTTIAQMFTCLLSIKRNDEASQKLNG